MSSLTLENILSLHPKVREFAVVGVPHEKWGEWPVAVLVPVPGAEIGEEEKYLMQYVEKGTITKWAIPDRFIFVKELPKTSVGEIDKKIIRKQMAELFGK